MVFLMSFVSFVGGISWVEGFSLEKFWDTWVPKKDPFVDFWAGFWNLEFVFVFWLDDFKEFLAFNRTLL